MTRPCPHLRTSACSTPACSSPDHAFLRPLFLLPPFVFVLYVCVFVFQDRVSLCSPFFLSFSYFPPLSLFFLFDWVFLCCPQAIRFRDPIASAFWMLGLQAHGTDFVINRSTISSVRQLSYAITLPCMLYLCVFECRLTRLWHTWGSGNSSQGQFSPSTMASGN